MGEKPEVCAKPSDAPAYAPGIRLSIEQVNGLLTFLMDVPYRYAEPLIRTLKEEVEKQHGPQ